MDEIETIKLWEGHGTSSKLCDSGIVITSRIEVPNIFNKSASTMTGNIFK